jgi:hypothetical protein
MLLLMHGLLLTVTCVARMHDIDLFAEKVSSMASDAYASPEGKVNYASGAFTMDTFRELLDAEDSGVFPAHIVSFDPPA